jgi:hypothetical protein
VYVVVVLGVTVIEDPDAPPGDHENVPPGTVALAVKVACCPAHAVVLVTETTGTGLIVTVTGVNADGQPIVFMLHEIVHNPLLLCTPCVVLPPTTPPI